MQKKGEEMRYLFCPKCGGKLKYSPTSIHPICSDCHFIFYQNPIVGVAAIVIEQEKILLGKRAGSYEGKWCIPCGYVEWDEDVNEAVKKEFYEETNLFIHTCNIYTVHSNFHNSNQHTVGLWFLTTSYEGNLQAGDDIKDARFFSYDELPPLAFPTDRLVIEQLKQEQKIK